MAKKGYKCKGRTQNGQLMKGYTLRNGRVVRRTRHGNVTKNGDKSH